MKRVTLGAIALLSLPLAALAQQSDPAKTKVTPGTEATKQMSEEVPQMKGGCPEDVQADTKARGTEATEAMGKNVPTMTAENLDCPPDGKQKSKSN